MDRFIDVIELRINKLEKEVEKWEQAKEERDLTPREVASVDKRIETCEEKIKALIANLKNASQVAVKEVEMNRTIDCQEIRRSW